MHQASDLEQPYGLYECIIASFLRAVILCFGDHGGIAWAQTGSVWQESTTPKLSGQGMEISCAIAISVRRLGHRCTTSMCARNFSSRRSIDIFGDDTSLVFVKGCDKPT
jgi:hypothetical protein